MKLSASQAAKAANVSGSTIGRAIKSGKLSAVQTDDGIGWLIDPAELDRWQGNRVKGPQSYASQDAAEPPVQDREIALLREMLDEMRIRAERAEDNADHWREQANANRLLIEDLTRKQSVRPPSWWDRLRGKSDAA